MGEVESKQCGAREQNAALWLVKKIVSSFFWILYPLNLLELKSDCDNIAISVAIWLETFCCMEVSKIFGCRQLAQNCCELHFELQDRIQMTKMITWRKLQFVVLSNLKMMNHCSRECRLKFAYTSLDKKSEKFKKGKNVLFQKKMNANVVKFVWAVKMRWIIMWLITWPTYAF